MTDTPPFNLPPSGARFDALAAQLRDAGYLDIDLHYSSSALLLSRRWELWVPGKDQKRRVRLATGATPTEAAEEAVAALAARPALAAVKP